MMMKLKKVTIFIIATVLLFEGQAQHLPKLIIRNQPVEFDHLYFESDRNFYNVEDIITDPYGFIWIGTKEGLFRYDGHDVVSMNSAFLPSLSFSNNTVLSLALSADSSLWILTPSEIYKLKLPTFSLKTYSIDFNVNKYMGNILRGDLWLDEDTMLYAGFWGAGFVTMNPITGNVVHFSYDSIRFPVPSNTVTSIYKRDNETLWVGTHDGLFIFYRTTQSFEKYHIQQNGNKPTEKAWQINAITKSPRGYFWFGTNEGVVQLNAVSNEWKHFNFIPYIDQNLERYVVEAVTFDNGGKLWAGTRFGLYQFDPITYDLNVYHHDKNDSKSLQSNYVRKIYCDDKDIVWVGHHDGTLSKITPRQKNFTTYTLDSEYSGDLRVFSVYKENEHIWFGTETGLYNYNRESGNLFRFSHDDKDPNSLSHNFVSGIAKDNHGHFWISTDKGGLNKFDPEKGKFTNILSGSNEIASHSLSDIWSIMLDSRNQLWCGTGGTGLYRVNTLTGEVKKFQHDPERKNSLSDNFIGPIVEYSHDFLFVGSYKGLNYFNPQTDTALHFTHEPDNPNSIKSNVVVSLCVSTNNKLWIGTSQGLSIMDLSTFEIDNSFSSTLGNVLITGIIQDISGDIWISTQKGLYKFDKTNDIFRHYRVSDGISHNNFVSGSYFQAADGELFFGTHKGLTSFYPWEIKNNDHIPPAYITNVMVGDASVMYRRGYRSSFSDKDLALDHNQNNLKFSIAALDFYDPEKNQLSVMLDGFDKTWKELENTNDILYNNLPPGKYVFRVQVSNNDNLWNKNGDYLEIFIAPPFWKTIAFRIMLVVFIMTGIYLLVYMRIRQIRIQKAELENLVAIRTKEVQKQKENIEQKHHALEQQKSAIEHQAVQLASINKKLEAQQSEIQHQAEELREMNRLKSRFFANISHEFRTPLTLILNALGELKRINENHTGENHKKLGVIGKNANRLLRLIDQLLDLTKIESGFMDLAVSEENFQQFIRPVIDAYELKAQATEITFTSDIDTELQHIYADWDKLEKILYNLLSNAFKFTAKNGWVHLEIKQEPDEEKHIKIRVADNGRGIPKEMQKKIFSRFYRHEQSDAELKPGTGIGLALTKQLIKIYNGRIGVESEPNKGAVFSVWLPCSKTGFPENSFVSGRKPEPMKDFIDNYQSPEVLPEPLPYANKQGKAVLLFIDDNKELCHQVSDYFSRFFHVIVAYDGLEGYHAAIEHIPDVVVSDLMMPELSGIDLCLKIKKDIRTNHIPFILLTAKKDDEAQKQALHSGADDYINKPFSMHALALKIQNQLKTRKIVEQKMAREFSDASATKGNGFSNSFLNKAVEVIQKNIEDPDFGINDLARELNLSRTQLYRKFNGLISVPLNDFIKDVKLKKAHQLLLTGDYNITEVATKCGFNTPGYFSRCFEQKYGILPSKFLANQGL